MKRPRKGSKAYKEIVAGGCKGYKYWTDCGYEHDCGGDYDWDCDYCPVVVENEEHKIEIKESIKESIKKMNEDIEKLFNEWIKVLHILFPFCDLDILSSSCVCQENFLKMYELEKEIADRVNKRLVLYKYLVKE